jgi:hypothetical protein
VAKNTSYEARRGTRSREDERVRSLTWNQVRALRLQRNQLVERASAERLVEVVRATCGIQAQVLSAAELALAARVDDIKRADVHQELWERRRLVKTWTLRGTLHLHPADELPLWIAATSGGRAYWRDPRWLEALDLTAAQADSILESIVDALDGRCLSREELGAEVADRVGRWALEATPAIQFGKPALKWPQLIGAAASTGRLCFGPSRRNRVTFVRADQWIPDWKPVDPGDALAEAFRRYLAAYGPARADDFAHWLQPARRAAARELAGSLSSELEEVDVEGYRGWMLAGDAQLAEKAARPVRLLPQYDCYVIGAAPPGTPRERLIPPTAGSRVFDRGAGPFALLLADGAVAGLWDRRRRGRRLELTVTAFGRLAPRTRRRIEAEAERIGRFLGLEPEVAIVTES